MGMMFCFRAIGSGRMPCRTFAVLLVAAVVSGCGAKTAPSSSVTANTTSNSQATPDASATSSDLMTDEKSLSASTVSSTEPQVQVTQDGIVIITPEYLAEHSDTLAQLHPEQALEITGTIQSFSTILDNERIINFKHSHKNEYADAACKMGDPGVFAAILPGQTVTLRGSLRKSELHDDTFVWKIHKRPEVTGPVISAERLAEMFQSNHAKAQRTIRHDHFYLTGSVEKVEDASSVLYNVFLKVSGSTVVKLGLTRNISDPKTPLKSGDDVVVIARLAPFSVVAGLTSFSPEGSTLELESMRVLGEFPRKDVSYASEFPVPQQRVAAQVELLKQQTPVKALSSEAFVASMEANENNFQDRVKGQLVEVAGPVNRFGRDPLDDSLLMKAGEREFYVSMLLAEPWRDVDPGQVVTVRGVAWSEDGDFGLTDGVIVKSVPPQSPVPSTTAETIALERLKSSEEFEGKWKDKYVKLTGKIKSITPEVFGVVELETDQDTQLKCYLISKGEADLSQYTKLSAGETIQLLGKVDSIEFSDEKNIVISDCLILR